MIVFHIQNQSLTLRSPTIAADTLDYLTAQCFFSADWNGLDKWVHFQNGDTVFDVQLQNDRITQHMHLNLSAGEWSVYLHGNQLADGTVVKRITTEPKTLSVLKTGMLNGSPLPVTPPSAGEQILAVAQNAVDTANSVRADADAGAFNGKDGYTPVKGVDYFDGKDGLDGKDGAPGRDGADGQNGADGRDGLDAPQIDDTTITTANPWSSKQIIDTLCRADTQSGDLVQGHFVAGYPLGGRLDIVARQEGEGAPSPDNVRPIVGVDSVGVTVCGENLIDFFAPAIESQDVIFDGFAKAYGGLTATVKDGYVTVTGTKETDGWVNLISVTFKKTQTLPAGTYTIDSGLTISVKEKGIQRNVARQLVTNGCEVVRFYIPFFAAGAVNARVPLMVVSDTTELTAYSPYHGTTHAIALPSTCYGGYIDWERGKLVCDYGVKVFDGTENILDYGNEQSRFKLYLSIQDAFVPENTGLCSHFTVRDQYSTGDISNSIFMNVNKYAWYFNVAMNPAEFKAYLAEQYAAGNPMKVVYKKVTPIEYDLPALPTLTALDGVTTVYTDAGPVTITGRADPRHDYAELHDRLAALEASATNV